MINFNGRLKMLRNEKRRTQEDVATFLNIKRATYSGYERGVIMPPYDKIAALAKYFGVSVEYLMGEKMLAQNEEQPVDAIKTLSNLLHDLKDDHAGVFADGVLLDKESRELLITSLENSLKMTKYITQNNKKG